MEWRMIGDIVLLVGRRMCGGTGEREMSGMRAGGKIKTGQSAKGIDADMTSLHPMMMTYVSLQLPPALQLYGEHNPMR